MTGSQDQIDSQTEEEARRLRALDLFLDAWEAALAEGLEPDLLAQTAIFAALTDLVDNHGEEHTARLAEALPQRVRDGEFTLIDGEDG